MLWLKTDLPKIFFLIGSPPQVAHGVSTDPDGLDHASN